MSDYKLSGNTATSENDVITLRGDSLFRDNEKIGTIKGNTVSVSGGGGGGNTLTYHIHTTSTGGVDASVEITTPSGDTYNMRYDRPAQFYQDDYISLSYLNNWQLRTKDAVRFSDLTDDYTLVRSWAYNYNVNFDITFKI